MAEVLNIDDALERIGGDREFLFELLNEFVQQVDDNLPVLDKAIKIDDFENVKLIAHGLRGAAGNLSISGMHNALTEIEALAVAKGNSKMGLFLSKVYEEQSALKKFLKEHS